MIQAITRCPSCLTSFRVTESQLLMAEGSVRCGNCLEIFQAEDYFVAPLLDITERIAIEQEYWLDFESYMLQVSRSQAPDDPGVAVEEEDQGLGAEPDLMSDFIDFVNTHPGQEPSAEVNKEPSAEEDKEPSAEEDKEPSAEVDKEPSAEEDKEPSAEVDKESSAEVNKEPSAEENKEPSAEVDKEPSAEEEPSAEADKEPAADEEPPTEEPASPTVLEEAAEAVALVDPEGFTVHIDEAELVHLQRHGPASLGWRWLPGILLLVIAAMGQYAWFSKDTHVQDARYRDYYVTGCRLVGCDIPEYDNLDQLSTRELLIRTHPAEPDALIVDVVLHNGALFRQRFPGLKLEFFDLNGEVVASRVFQVQEYLGGELRGLKFIPARTEVRLSLELVDPGNTALGYQMKAVRLRP